jgi:hypothetical protein
VEEFAHQVGAAARAAVPPRLSRFWDRVVVDARHAPAGSGGCTVTTTCHERGTRAAHPVEIDPEVAVLFEDLHAQMAATGQDWKQAVFILHSDNRFELDFEYE